MIFPILLLEDGDILAQSMNQRLGLLPPINGKKSPEIQRDMDRTRTSGFDSPSGCPNERASPIGPGNHTGVHGNSTPIVYPISFSVAPVQGCRAAMS